MNECMNEWMRNYNIKRESRSFKEVLYPGWIGIWRCWFLQREENRRGCKNSSGKSGNQEINWTHVWCQARIEPRTSLLECERSHWLRHLCFPKWEPKQISNINKGDLTFESLFSLTMGKKSSFNRARVSSPALTLDTTFEHLLRKTHAYCVSRLVCRERSGHNVLDQVIHA